MRQIQDLITKRAEAINSARSIVDKLETENRSEMNTEEKVSYDKAISEATELRNRIDRLVKQEELEKSLNDISVDSKEDKSSKTNSLVGTVEYRNAFASFIKSGKIGLSDKEQRALSSVTIPDGGALIASEQFVNLLIKFLDDNVAVRTLATVFQVPKATSLGAPSLDTDIADADWTTDVGTGSEDSSMKFGKRSLFPTAIAKRIKVPNPLLRMAMMNVEELVTSRLGYKFAITEEKAFLTGSGAGQPLGIFTASNLGIPTSRDVSAGNTTTEIKADNLIEVKYSLKQPYQAKARWMFHRDGIKSIAKLKDGNGQYLWQMGLQASAPDTLLNSPVTQSEYVPNVFTTGLYVGAYGDFSNYWIADALDMTIQRLDELYAESNNVGFIGRKETDGMPVVAEAFARVKLA